MDELMRDLGISTFEELAQYLFTHPEDGRVKELNELMKMFEIEIEMFDDQRLDDLALIMEDLGVNNKEELYNYMKAHPEEPRVQQFENMIKSGSDTK